MKANTALLIGIAVNVVSVTMYFQYLEYTPVAIQLGVIVGSMFILAGAWPLLSQRRQTPSQDDAE